MEHHEEEIVMYGKARRVSLAAAVAVAAAVLAGGTAQAHATAPSAQPHAAATPAAQNPIYLWAGEFATWAAANAEGNRLIGQGFVEFVIVPTVVLGKQIYELLYR
ncbi:hypothetical protein PUR61_29610 [Streptomyces sp. BE20]|uniref:hypothetical protein n=1 Tax=Streptomyces sp. BE20 TaxID=3002525 RepID=UPI002E791D47|nr:hypothetical protein [Streptomyces sp. BE20]MEE1826313.1 hypothetical protein [Streptomyces sp. BE20]